MNRKFFWGRRINMKTANSIANKLNVDEEKMKELVNGEREIEGKTLDKVLQAVEEEKINQPIKNIEILQWYRDTDLKALRIKFGYNSQTEVANILGCHASTICNFEQKKPVNQVGARLIQLYNFYQNDFNRKANNGKQLKATAVKNKLKANRLDKDIVKWYKNTDIRALRGDKTAKELAKEIGMSQSCYTDVERRLFSKGKVNKSIRKVYNYYNDIANDDNELYEKEVYDWYTSISDLREYSRQFGYSKNKLMSELNLSWDQIKDFENHRYKKATDVVKRAYEFYHNENNRLPAVETSDNLKKAWNKSKEIREARNNKVATLDNSEEETKEQYNILKNNSLNTQIYNLEPECVEEHQGYYSGYITEDEHYNRIAELQKTIDELEDKLENYLRDNARLEKQISRYEKLIDRL